ncbi:FosX/FosE/FosI family fosfomycin resistance hydrolase [Devosia nitrariae]|uniref:FosX/FosE/FosI family fosfomycin resistance thiol transferase n=1 Tax=Devosia nitrariae TaxID=2071872 RepID=A0ABQ5WBC6_9HYPH|nr:FosX/FosE/FosI family fosfomycin resistance hydrolase [Devosia nitrariae]GLQ57403.1 FosX/FosE/FosI family fosfomycin resistance thiol transferase [Devosia nitrariae]
MSDPRPAGLSHMTFVVADLDAMEEILIAVLDARKVYDSGQEQVSLSEERFYLVGDEEIWIAVMKGEALASRTYNHIAFKIDEADFDSYRQRIAALGLDIRESRPRVAGEGRSLYFHDRDNHLFELHTGTLSERLARYARGREPDSDIQPMSPSP